MPALFDQASELVTVDAIAEKMPCGPDPEPVVELVGRYLEAGYDRIYLNQIGPDQDGFFRFFTDELAPALADLGAAPDSDGSLVDLRVGSPAGAS